MKGTAAILTILLALAQLSHAQAYKNEKVIYLDANGEKTKEKNAVALEQLIKIEDTLYQINFYRIDGPMFKSFRANDPDGKRTTGSTDPGDAEGQIDSSRYHAGKLLGTGRSFPTAGTPRSFCMTTENWSG